MKAVDSIYLNAMVHAGFSSRNNQVLADTGGDIVLKPHNILPIPTTEMIYTPADLDFNILSYQANPIVPLPLSLYMDDSPEGLVIIAPGSGNIALNKGGIREALAQAQQKRIPVVAVTDCTHGYIDFKKITHGQEILDLGVISGGAMTEATAVSKLRSLLSCQIAYEKIPAAMAKDVVGETRSLPKILSMPNGVKPPNPSRS